MNESELKIIELRLKIDAIDNLILKYLNERKLLSIEIIKTKLTTKDEIYNPTRENEIIARLTGDANNHLSYETLESLYTIIFEDSKNSFQK